MAFNSDTQSRLVDALGLETTQDDANSLLKQLMNEVERRDTQNGTNRVGEIEKLIDSVESNQQQLSASVAGDGVKRISYQDDVEIEYKAGASGSTGTLTQLNANKQKIIAKLGPGSSRLARYRGSGRIVSGWSYG